MEQLKNYSYEEKRSIVMNPEFIHRFEQLQEATEHGPVRSFYTALERLNMTITVLAKDMKSSQIINSYGSLKKSEPMMTVSDIVGSASRISNVSKTSKTNPAMKKTPAGKQGSGSKSKKISTDSFDMPLMRPIFGS
jgi:hypothetical protein